MRTRFMRRCVNLYLFVFLIGACQSASKDWDEEVILQLFKPENVEVGQISLLVTQKKTVPLKNAAIHFNDCAHNKIRIIPQKEGAQYPDISIDITCEKLSRCLSQSLTLTPPVINPVKVLLGHGINYEPKGCEPPKEAGINIDAGPKKVLGETCSLPDECGGGVCLQKKWFISKELIFKDGYCTRVCSHQGDSCNGDGICYDFQLTSGKKELYCLKKCSTSADPCREGYQCSTADLCVPN